jgi:hypothetical protein
MHIGEMLDGLPNDEARAQYCKWKAEECRNRFFQGQQEMIDRIQNPTTKSGKIRYELFSQEQRKRIAMMLWQSSTTAKEILSDEHMFSRWAGMYAGTMGIKE